MKNNRIIPIIIFLLIIIATPVTGLTIRIEYFDNPCYDNLCLNSEILNENGSCFFTPIIPGNRLKLGSEKGFDNFNEFESLKGSKKSEVINLFRSCVNRNQTAEGQAVSQFSRNLVSGFMMLFTQILISIILISLLVFQINFFKSKKVSSTKMLIVISAGIASFIILNNLSVPTLVSYFIATFIQYLIIEK